MKKMENVKDIVPENSARGKLFYAFLQLLEHKRYDKIKVSELIEAADVNRSTFYRYYSDIYDFYDRICSGGLFYTTSGLDKCAENKSLEVGLNAFYAVITERIALFADVLKRVCGKNGSVLFLSKFRGYLLDRFEEAFKPQTKNDGALLLFFTERIYVYLLRTVCGSADIEAISKNSYVYSPEKGVFENIVDCISPGNSAVFRALMTVGAQTFLMKEPRSLNVNNITKNACVSRTEFYNYFGNMSKMITAGVNGAIFAFTQIMFTLTVCAEDDFAKLVPPLDIHRKMNTDAVVELVRHHREYYLFVSSSSEYLAELLKKHLSEKGTSLGKAQYGELLAYASWATIGYVTFADNPNDIEFKNRIMWGRKRLAEHGIEL